MREGDHVGFNASYAGHVSGIKVYVSVHAAARKQFWIPCSVLKLLMYSALMSARVLFLSML